MKNMTKKRVISGILTVALCALMCSTVLAGNLIPGGDLTYTKPPDAEMEKMSSNILGIIQYISFGVVLGMLIYLGIKYMTSAANEKADIKNASMRYIIGAIIVFGVTGIFSALWETLSESWKN